MPLSSRMAAVRREIAALGRADLDVLDLHTHAIELVGRVVPYDATCWASTDPVLMIPTGSLTIDFDPTAEQEALFISVHTVQDHLKSIFAKVGVSSRRELAAALGIAY